MSQQSFRDMEYSHRLHILCASPNLMVLARAGRRLRAGIGVIAPF